MAARPACDVLRRVVFLREGGNDARCGLYCRVGTILICCVRPTLLIDDVHVLAPPLGQAIPLILPKGLTSEIQPSDAHQMHHWKKRTRELCGPRGKQHTFKFVPRDDIAHVCSRAATIRLVRTVLACGEILFASWFRDSCGACIFCTDVCCITISRSIILHTVEMNGKSSGSVVTSP